LVTDKINFRMGRGCPRKSVSTGVINVVEVESLHVFTALLLKTRVFWDMTLFLNEGITKCLDTVYYNINSVRHHNYILLHKVIT
jgi:hypothetical protein